MIELVLIICYTILFIAALFGLIRLMMGPSILDRILAFDGVALSVAGMVILFSIKTQSVYFLEILLIFCLLGFTTTMAYMDYLSQVEQTKQGDEENGVE